MKGTLYVVGIGPGAYEQMTIQAAKTLEACDVIAGYTVYVDLIREHFPSKEFLSTPMMQETKRCRMALAECEKGKNTAMICSGDSGVYGMAGLILELSEEFPQVEVQIIPGVTAACSGAAVLGAPLGHDFAVISLSDLLTPLDTIWKRMEAAAAADFAVCIYNPSSKKRADYLQRACDILLKYRSPHTVCGLVSHIGRPGEMMETLTLKELRNRQTDMFTTVFVGNSQTKIVNEKMVTPRGYRHG